MQLLVFDCAPSVDPRPAIERLGRSARRAHARAVIYEDVNAPRGLGVLTWSEDPGALREPRAAGAARGRRRTRAAHRVLHARPHLRDGLRAGPALLAARAAGGDRSTTSAGRGRCGTRCGAAARSRGSTPREQAAILREHGTIGRAYGEQDLAHDIRLACHGLDAHDNEFVIGLVGKELHPLSHVVQAMRKTRQTAEFIAQMGPFFVGHVARRVG